MTKGPLLGLLLLATAGAAIYFLFLMLHRWVYSRPKPLDLDGVRYMWERDPDCPLWVRQFKRGRFRYPDGRPVTDPNLLRRLQLRWLEDHRGQPPIG